MMPLSYPLRSAMKLFYQCLVVHERQHQVAAGGSGCCVDKHYVAIADDRLHAAAVGGDYQRCLAVHALALQHVVPLLRYVAHIRGHSASHVVLVPAEHQRLTFEPVYLDALFLYRFLSGHRL